MKYLATFLAIVLLLTGCQKQEVTTIYSDTINGIEESLKNEIYFNNGEIRNGKNTQRKVIEPNDGKSVVTSNITHEYEISSSIESPDYNFSDAVYMNDSIIATDKKGNQLVILNNDLKVMSTIGTFGSGNVEFLSPVAIDKDENNNLYILDGGNYRIQVLDSMYNYIKEIKLDFLGDSMLAGMNLGFIVDNNGEFAYFSETYQGILLCIDLNTGKIDKLEEYSSGKFTKDNEFVYYINNYIYTGDSINMTMNTEEVFLYKINGKDIINKVRLYDGLNSSGITLIYESLYYMSYSNFFMIEYDLEGNYISTPYAGVLLDQEQMNKLGNLENFFNAAKGKVYSSTYNIIQGSNDDIIAIYNSSDREETIKGGAIGILRKVKE